jgi:predicted dehydrogenase
MYGPVLRYLERGQVTALVDPDPDRLRSMQDLSGAHQLFNSFDEFLKHAEVDAVVIVSPVPYHHDQAIACAERGWHVLSEKPMARTVAECDEMIQACQDNGVILQVALMKRFDKSFMYAKEIIDSGELGEVFQVRCDWSWYHRGRGGWREDLGNWGGMFQDHGSHTVDLCRWWLGEIKHVSGEINVLQADREVEDQAVALLRHRNGAVSLHHQLRCTHKPLNEYYLIDGDKGSLEIEFGPAWSFTSTDPFTMRLWREGRVMEDVTQYNVQLIDEEQQQHNRYLAELRHFCDCIISGEEPRVTGFDGRAAIEVINAVYLSSWNEETVSLPLTDSAPDLESIFSALQGQGIKLPVA